MPDKRLFLLDAFALIYRAHFALVRTPLINSKGLNVSAITGFTNTLNDLLKREEPSHLAVVFDLGTTTRELEHSFYKANRQAMPEDISIAIPIIKEVIRGFRVPSIELEGFEADDLIGTLAKQAEKAGYQVYMVTPDKDFGQLVSDNIFMYKPAYMGRPIEIMGLPEILDKWQIERPEQVIDILGLMGDSVDNIPGIPKVGPKTAMKLIGEFGSIENVIANADKLKGKLQENIIEYAEQGMVSKELATIVLDAPIKFNEKEFLVEEPDPNILSPLFAELEFRSIGKRILGQEYNVNASPTTQQMDLFSAPVAQEATGGAGLPTAVESGKSMSNTPQQYHLVTTDAERKDLARQLIKQKSFCLETLTTNRDPNESELLGISFCWKPGKAWFVLLPDDKKEAEEILQLFKESLESEKISKLSQDIKFDRIVLRWFGINLEGEFLDTMIAHYLIEPEKRHELIYLAENFLGYTPISAENLIGKAGKKQLNWRDVDPGKISNYNCERADLTLQLHHFFEPIIKKQKIEDLYHKLEIPLARVLSNLEYEGVAIDTGFLAELSGSMNEELIHLRESVFSIAGEEFNMDSPKQLGTVLFDNLGIEYKGKKTKTGQYSTSEDVLTKLAGDQEIVKHILEYREIGKLKSTYVDALPELINPITGRVHTTLSQIVAATGRLSSNNPNLQNIPIRTERGRQIRKAFIPRDKNHVILSADYSQIELRIIASIADDEAMIKAFRDQIDIHTATAAKVYGVELEDVTREMRGKAKMVNFSISYGVTAFGLSQRLQVPRKEAAELISNYFATYPGIKAYMEKTVEEAKELGYVETLMGRRRYLKDINSRNHTIRGHAERNAVNSPIQGTAADMIKKAMIDVEAAMKKEGFKSPMTLQVHDELVFDALKEEVDELQILVAEKMRDAFALDVPVVVETGVGDNWLEAH